MHEFKCEDALEMERELELFWPSIDLDSWLADLQIFGHTNKFQLREAQLPNFRRWHFEEVLMASAKAAENC